MKKVIYTAIFNDSDILKEPYCINPGWEYICYTDNATLRSDVWDVKFVESTGDPKKQSRYYKTHPPEADLTVWIDGTFEIRKPLDPFALSKKEGIWLNAHTQRNCWHEEAMIVKEKGLDSPEVIDSQIAKCEMEGLPKNSGLWRCGIMVRDNSPEIEQLNKIWWEEIEQFSWRDQISFVYACHKSRVTPNNILHGITNIYFRQHLHLPKPTDTWSHFGEDYDPKLTERYQGAHMIILKNTLIYPSWLALYINPYKVGRDRAIELVKILNGIVVRA